MSSKPLRITYLGHATVLVEIGGARFLTDPVLRPRIAHLRRRVELPPRHLLDGLDGVLLSHGHHDHLDLPSLRALPGTPPLLAGPAAALAVRRARLATPLELGEGESELIAGVEVSAVEAVHDGRRWPWLPADASVGFLLRSGPGPGVYFAGDTDLFGGMGELGRRVEVALLPISGWGPRVGVGHLDPERAAEATARIAPRVVVPIHWGTYSRIGMKADPAALRDPLIRFSDQLAERAPSVLVEPLEPGESVELPGPSSA